MAGERGRTPTDDAFLEAEHRARAAQRVDGARDRLANLSDGELRQVQDELGELESGVRRFPDPANPGGEPRVGLDRLGARIAREKRGLVEDMLSNREIAEGPRTYAPEEVTTAVSAVLDGGERQVDVAKALGISARTVKGWVARERLRRRGQEGTPAEGQA